MIITYQDLLKVGNTPKERAKFVNGVVNTYRSSDEYKQALIRYDYIRQMNTTICTYQKLLYMVTGEAVPDNYSANFKLCSNFFNKFITDVVSYLLGNGIIWKNQEQTVAKLGEDFAENVFDTAFDGMTYGKSYGFWNYDHMEVFNPMEYLPLPDEETNAHKAGIYFKQIDSTKPLRATLYELDGYTNFMWSESVEPSNEWMLVEKGVYMMKKKPYINVSKSTEVDGVTDQEGENYSGYPIVPFTPNRYGISSLVGLRENIDAYDLIKSGFANTVDDASLIYWTINNAGGMDEIDLAKFIDHMKRLKAAVIDDSGARAEAHTLDVPYASREAVLDRLRNDMYEDFMALDTKNIANGAITATQITAAYDPLDKKADGLERYVTKFIKGILAIAGVDDVPTYIRSRIVNSLEEMQKLMTGAQFLPAEYVTRRVVSLLGDIDHVEEVLQMMEDENIRRYTEDEEDEQDEANTGSEQTEE